MGEILEKRYSEIGQQIFNKSPYMLYIFKLDGTMVDCNKKAEEWLGYDRSEIIGENYGIIKLDNCRWISRMAIYKNHYS